MKVRTEPKEGEIKTPYECKNGDASTAFVDPDSGLGIDMITRYAIKLEWVPGVPYGSWNEVYTERPEWEYDYDT